MSRWLPQSLFSRLVLVLLAGLVLAQAAGLAIYWRDRDEFMQRAFGMRSVQRIADMIRLLDDMPVAERSRIIGVLNSPQLRISFDVPPLVPAEQPGNQEEAQMFSSALRRSIGDERPLVVSITEAPFITGPPPGFAPAMKSPMMGAGMGMRATPGAFRLYALSFVVQTPLRGGALITFDSRQSRDAVASPWRLFASVTVLLGAVIAIALIAVSWVTRPLKTLADAAEQLGNDMNRPPLDEAGPVEVSRAAKAFNTMQRRIAKMIAERAQVFAAMSHDLKTPITRLRLRAELLDDAALREKFERDLQEMEQMVGGALDLVRGSGTDEAVQPVDIMSLLESVRDDAKLGGGTVEIEGNAGAPYPGRPQALKRCLANLIDNALKYGHAAQIALTDDGRACEIRIRDRGPGIPERELGRVFEPFYRLERSRNRDTGGSGLGLTIARDIARAHRGELALRNLEQGGIEAVLTLPRPRAADAPNPATS